MVDWETYLSSYFQLYGRGLSPGKGERALLLIYIPNEGIGRTLLTTGVSCTLLSIVGKVFCKILNNRLVQCLDKEVVMVFSKYAINGCWMWGEYSLPIVSPYCYFGIDLSSNGAWDMHTYKDVIR